MVLLFSRKQSAMAGVARLAGSKSSSENQDPVSNRGLSKKCIGRPTKLTASKGLAPNSGRTASVPIVMPGCTDPNQKRKSSAALCAVSLASTATNNSDDVSRMEVDVNTVSFPSTQPNRTDANDLLCESARPKARKRSNSFSPPGLVMSSRMAKRAKVTSGSIGRNAQASFATSVCPAVKHRRKIGAAEFEMVYKCLAPVVSSKNPEFEFDMDLDDDIFGACQAPAGNSEQSETDEMYRAQAARLAHSILTRMPRLSVSVPRVEHIASSDAFETPSSSPPTCSPSHAIATILLLRATPVKTRKTKSLDVPTRILDKYSAAVVQRKSPLRRSRLYGEEVDLEEWEEDGWDEVYGTQRTK